MGVSFRRVRTLLIVAAFLVSSVGLLSVRPTEVRANSISWGTNGNCNNWYPHGWSSLSWSGFDGSAWGETWGDLDHWNGSTWVSYIFHDTYAQGGSTQANIDNYYNVYSYGTGWWEQTGTHQGSMITGTPYETHNFWCG